MRKLQIRLVLVILVLVLFTSISYLGLVLSIPDNILKSENLPQLQSIILLAGLGITATVTIITFLISFPLVRSITRPINDLIKASKAIAKRNFNQHIKTRTYTEIEELACSFQGMVEELKLFEQDMQKRRQGLENIAREQAKELRYIYRIGREISSSLDLDAVLNTIIKRTTEVLNLRICAILLIDDSSSDALKVCRAKGINLKRIEKETVKKGEGISGWVRDKKEALLIKNLEQDNRFLARIKERYYTGSLISVPLEAKNRIIGVINANNKIDGRPFKKTDLLLLKEIATESAIAVENARLYKSLKEVYIHTISALARALDAKDHYTRSHSENVTRYTVAIAKEIGLSVAQIEIIRQACQLHDLGKIGIHDYILTKKGSLTSDEWKEIKLHALRGAQILQPIGFLKEVALLVRQHHERYDGKGYPSKLSGRDIQIGARIMAVADAFDAMVSERPYRQAFNVSQAIEELKANSGTQFDPEIVKLFLKIIKNNPDLVKIAKR